MGQIDLRVQQGESMSVDKVIYCGFRLIKYMSLNQLNLISRLMLKGNHWFQLMN